MTILLLGIIGTATVHSQDAHSPAVDSLYVRSVNQFGFALLDNLSSKDSTKNVFISPASILFALAMADNGAEGSTDDAIRNALHLDDFSTAVMNASNVRLMRLLMQADTSVELAIANSVWMNEQFALKSEFMRVCEEDYNAGAYRRNFSSEATVAEINGWVKEKTRGKIDRILDALDPDEILVLLDAVYFYGKWTHQFEEAETKEKPFLLLDGSEKNYPRMVQRDTYPYFDDGQYQVVSIPYGKRYSMVVYLPRERAGLRQLVANFAGKDFRDPASGLALREGVIELPRFRIDYSASLEPELTGLGMGIAFGRDANFSRMTDTAAHIDRVMHKTYVEVNEKGTTAAAVSSVGVAVTTALRPQPISPFEMIIDHPFLCLIKDNVSGLVLFSGAILDPTPGGQ